MKSQFVAALAVLAANIVNAHYTFPDLVIGSTVVGTDWQYIRKTENYNSQGPVTDVTTPEIRCYETNTASGTSTYTVSAGSTVGFKADNSIFHPGYYSAYMSVASPAANSESAGTGQTWFKIWEDPPKWTPGTSSLTFPDENETQFTFTIPAATPSGQYLLRGEHIALHTASNFGGAQFYIACAQLNVINGGSGTPGPLVSFPDTYTGHEPGILINIYSVPAGFTGYQPPGPAIWNGSGGGGSPTTKTVSTTTTSTTPRNTTYSTSSRLMTTASTTKPTTTTQGTGVLQVKYGQCGGIGWTGPTTCGAGLTCQVSNTYYSQCL